MDAATRALVRARAGHCCEYCGLPERLVPLAGFQIEHVIAKQHGGPDSDDNLALACHRCNLHKGPNLTGIDPVTAKVVRLFHPRRQKWTRHFRWAGPFLVGRTQTGRATIAVLAINHAERVALRAQLIAEGVFPPA
jgi:hypothetical protein